MQAIGENPRDTTRAASLLKVLANEQRLTVLCALRDGEMSASALQKRLAGSPSAVSQHLAKLRHENLVATRRHNQSILYRLTDPDILEFITLLAKVMKKARD